MQKTDALVRTKLHVPFTRPELIFRPGLIEQMRLGLQRPLTLVTAPAGFGKTTLVASCAADCGIPVAWLSLDKNDNLPGRFLTYVVAALQSADDRIGREAAQFVAGIQQAVPEAVLTSLINDLDGVGKEIALVLDDYQMISTQPVHEAVSFLLEYCPKTFHLVIATRSDPPFPLARLRARGQVVELRATDLRFTEDEAAQFLNEIMGLHLDLGSVALLEERTEGWIVGLQMAALSMRDRKDVKGFIEGFSGTNRYILDYLLEEVLNNQPPEIQHFLLYTSIVERLTAPLCDALLAGGENLEPRVRKAEIQSKALSSSQSTAVLEYLERQNLFLVSLDDKRTWFRYHHLFADLLRVRLQQTQTGTLHDLHLRASEWFEQNGFFTDAIQHFLAAGEVNRAAELVERYGSVHWVENDPSIVQMADSLPHETVVAHPKIGLYQAWLLIIQGRIPKVLPLLDEMARYFANEKLYTGQRWMQTVITLARAFLTPSGSKTWSLPLPDFELLDEIPDDEPILRDAADILYGMAQGRRGEIDLAAEVSEKSIQREGKVYKARGTPTLVPFLARVYLMQGRLHAAAALSREYLIPGRERETRFITSAGSMNVTLGEVLFEWNFVEEGEKHICDGLEANKPWQNIMTEAFGLSALARVLQAKGDYGRALQIIDQFEEKLRVRSRPREFNEDFYTLRARILLASGDLQGASKWAEQVHLSEDFQRHRELYRLALARVYLAQGRYDEIDGILGGEELQFAYGNRLARRLESNLLRAVALAAQDRLVEATQMIDSCLELGQPEGYIRTFVDVGEPARNLLAAYLRHDDAGYAGYTRQVLEAFPPSTGERSVNMQTAGLIEPISEREMEVLNLMAQGRTNKEIARQLIVAPGTIKAHAASIYRKLDVANRTEAVARARELGILS